MNINEYLDEQNEETIEQLENCIKLLKKYRKCEKELENNIKKLSKIKNKGICFEQFQKDCPHLIVTYYLGYFGFEDYRYIDRCKICGYEKTRELESPLEHGDD